MNPDKIRLRFIGTDGSMGLRTGKVYSVSIYTKLGDIVVNWSIEDTTGNKCCPYSSLKTLCKNWESV